MKLFVGMLIILVSAMDTLAEAGKVTVLKLGDECKIRIEEFAPSRATPWLYYNQAVESVPTIYPGSKFITKVKNGTVKTNTEFTYSLVSFVKNEESRYVIVGGNFRIKDKAWRYDADVPREKYDEIISLILVAISSGNF